MIPDYVYFVAAEFNISDAEIESVWEKFKYAKFIALDSRTLREFFFVLIAKREINVAINICKFIAQEIRVPKSHKAEFKHEYVIYYLNTISLEKAICYIIYALMNVDSDINFIRQMTRLLIKKKEIKGPTPNRPFGYL